MKKLIPLLILLSMICSCADTPESGKVPAPVFINDAQTTQERALDINVDITDSNNSRKEEARVMYYTEFPLISSFIPNGARVGEDIRTGIATDYIRLSVTKVGNIVTYEGQTDDDIYVHITLDTETNTFDYKQVALANVTLKQGEFKLYQDFAFITEGDDMRIHEDSVIEGNVKALYFRKSETNDPPNSIDIEMLKEEIYSDRNTHAIALLGKVSHMEDTSEWNTLPTLSEMKAMTIDSFGDQLTAYGDPQLMLYYHNESGFGYETTSSDPSISYDKKLEDLQNKANELFGEGKWELSIQE